MVRKLPQRVKGYGKKTPLAIELEKKGRQHRGKRPAHWEEKSKSMSMMTGPRALGVGPVRKLADPLGSIAGKNN